MLLLSLTSDDTISKLIELNTFHQTSFSLISSRRVREIDVNHMRSSDNLADLTPNGNIHVNCAQYWNVLTQRSDLSLLYALMMVFKMDYTGFPFVKDFFFPGFFFTRFNEQVLKNLEIHKNILLFFSFFLIGFSHCEVLTMYIFCDHELTWISTPTKMDDHLSYKPFVFLSI